MTHSNILVGRNKELKTIYETICGSADNNAVLIKGSAGIGKTHLVNSFLFGLNPKYYVVRGKFDKYNNSSHIAASEILTGIFDCFLSMPKKRYINIQKRIKSELGDYLSYIFSICENAKFMFRNIKSHHLGPYTKSKYNLKKAVQKIINIAAEELHPFILFIDDIQWADELSKEIILNACKEHKRNSYGVVLSSRPKKNDALLSKIEDITKSIKINPLTLEDIIDLLRSMYEDKLSNIEYLSRILYSMSLGNPFYIQKIIVKMRDESILNYDSENDLWNYNTSLLNSIKLPESITEVIKSKIDELSIDELYFLKSLVCFGNGCPETFIQHSSQVINILIEKSLVIKNENRLYFSHDIIHEYIFGYMDKKETEVISYTLASSLTSQVANINTSAEILILANCITKSNYENWTKDQKNTWYNLLVSAADILFDRLGFKEAGEIYSYCVRIIEEPTYDRPKTDMLSVYFKLFRCLYLSGNSNTAEKRLLELEKSYIDTADVLIIKREYIKMLAFNGNHEKVMTVGKQMLELLGFHYDSNNTEATIMGIESKYTDEYLKSILSKFDSDHFPDSQSITVLSVLYEIMPSAKIVGATDFMYVQSVMALYSDTNKGVCALCGYTALAYIFFTIINNFSNGKKVSDMVLQSTGILDESEKVELLSFYLTFVHHWSNPLSETITMLEEINEKCLEYGSISYFEYTMASLLFAYSASGLNLHQLKENIYTKTDKLKELGVLGNSFANDYVNKVLSSYLNSFTVTETKPIHNFESQYSSDLVSIWFTINSSYINGDIENAYEHLQKVTPMFDEGKGHIVYTDVIFYSTLIRLEYHNRLTGAHKDNNVYEINKGMEFLNFVTENFSANHEVRYLYVKALYDYTFDDGVLSAGCYNRGIELAEKQGNSLLAALGNMLASKLYKSIPKLNAFYKDEAANAFKKWGAVNIAQILKHKEKNEEQDSTPTSSLNILRKITEMSEKEAFIFVLEDIASLTQCDYSAFVFEKLDDMYIKCEKFRQGSARYYTDDINISHTKNASDSIINYAFRTADTITIEGKPDENLISYNNFNEYVLCVPLSYLGIIVGIAYLKSSKEFDYKSAEIRINDVCPSLLTKCENIKGTNIKEQFIQREIASPLTKKETEVLSLVSKGMSNSEISIELAISTGTVKTHLSNIFIKLDVSTRLQAVIKATEMKIIK